jgi:NADPH:quinone reductase-like Zn-dependent oxidoreductase
VYAVQFQEFGAPDVLTVDSFPDPHAGPGTIRIRVKAAGLSPVDLGVRSGRTAAAITFPHIPGVDAAGIVDEIGDGVSGVAIGDDVFGTVEISKLGGAAAEFAVLNFWAHRPDALPTVEAAAAGTSVETSTRALDLLDVHDGQTLLVDGASGGVGSTAIQLAIARGARVIATGREESFEFLSELGATPVLYGEGLAERVAELGIAVDLALDVAGKGSLPELIAIAGDAGSVLTLADFAGPKLGVRISMGEFAGEPDGKHGLEVAATLAEQGRFRIPVEAVFPFGRANEAHELAEAGGRRGKIVLVTESGN